MAEYIERDALCKWLHETMSAQTTVVGMAYVRDFWNKVLDIPAADVATVVHGKWVVSSDGYYSYCSECKNEPKNGEMTDYCPNCGARMDGEG